MDDKSFVKEEVEYLMSSAQALAVLLKDEDPSARHAVSGYVRFLLMNNDSRSSQYYLLTDFLAWYGERYLMRPIREVIMDIPPIDRGIGVEFGPGNGWLIGGLRDLFSGFVYGVDKRSGLLDYPGVNFIRQDLEAEGKIHNLELPKNTVIIANHFLHCVNNPGSIVLNYRKFPWVVIEPLENEQDTPFPYWHDQLTQFGATPITVGDIAQIFEGAGLTCTISKTVSGQEIYLWVPND